MAYKINNVDKIKDTKGSVTFKNVTVTNHYTFPAGIGTNTSNAYFAGARNIHSGSVASTISKLPFASTAPAVYAGGLLTVARGDAASSCSSTHFYNSGGATGTLPGTNVSNVIDKFAFATATNATDVGDLNANYYDLGGNQDGSGAFSSKGFVCGGHTGPGLTTANAIDTFPFAADGNATDAGDLGTASRRHSSQSSESHAYSSGGYTGPGTSTQQNKIQKFLFSTSNTSVDVGDLTQARGCKGASSGTHGYAAGTFDSPYAIGNVTIDKFPFASDANATTVGNLGSDYGIIGAGNCACSSEDGYNAGGVKPPPYGFSIASILKFSFSSDGNSTNTSQLAYANGGIPGHQG